MRYAIHEDNVERLEKKLTTIANKCRQYGCEFHYEQVGEEFRELGEGENKYTARFVIVEAEGVAKVNGWRFLATLQHTKSGNIIGRCDNTVEVPERYYTCDPVCEHCNTNRARRDTYIVYNDETGEFKQVGRACLKDFTGGLSAEAVANYISWFNALIVGEAPSDGGRHEHYFEVEEMARYIAETIRHFGYVRSQDPYKISTASRAYGYYAVDNGLVRDADTRRYRRAEMESVGFNAESEAAKAETAEAMAWIAGQDDSDNYMHNLKVICSTKYTTHRNFGIIASLFPTYKKELEIEAERREKERQEAEKAAKSEHVGQIGQRITVEAVSGRCVTSWDTPYGYTFLYEFIDASGNVFKWFASRSVDIDTFPVKVVGTVKEHSEYRGVKQTVLTRCKVS